MLRAALKSLLSRKLRLVLSGLAVVLGVMFVSGAFVLTDTLGRSFDGLFGEVYADTQVRVQGKAVLSEPVPVPAELVHRAGAVPGVATATGLVNADGARLIGANGKAVTTTFGRPRIGTNWVGETSLTRLREGRGPRAGDEIAINAGLATAGGVKLGDRVGVLTTQPKRQFTVVGIVVYRGERTSLGGGTEIAFHDSVAAELMLGRPGVFSAVDVKAAPGVTEADLRDRLRAALGTDYDIRTGAELRQAATAAAEADLGFFNDILLGFAGVSLFVGIFLILNTFSIIVAQRTGELALMRALGASRRQVIGSVLLEAVTIGLLAAVIGLGLGVGAGAVLAWVLARAAAGGAVALASFGVPAAAVWASFAVGLAITVLAALIPAVRAARVPPLAALREAATPDRPLTKITIAGAVVGAGGGTVLALGLSGGTDAALPILFGGVLLCFIAVALLTPAIARPVVSAIGWLLSWSVPGQLGRRNSGRNPRRTAITAAAMMVGVALVTCVNVAMTSARASFATNADDGSLGADLYISFDGNSDRPPTFDPAVLEKTRALPGVQAVAGMYYDEALIDGRRTGVWPISDVPAWLSMGTHDVVAGSFSLGPDQVVVDQATAAERGLHVGSAVEVTFARGQHRTLTISGLYASGDSSGWFLPESVVPDLTVPQPTYGMVKLAPGAPAADIRRQIEALLVDSPEVVVVDRAGFVSQWTSIFDTVLLMIQTLLALAMLISVLGIVNTMALSVLERTRELGLLRAVGLSRRQAMWMVTVEAVVISFFGALLGVAVGTGLGVAVVKALEGEGVTKLALPWGFIATYLLLGALVGVIAAVLPAIRAARVDVLRAISYE